MRTRNLRPGFFRNEDLAQLPFEGRLLFQGLWCLADCFGRLEERPLRMKADLFPYDSIDVAPLLDQLVAAGLVLRYEADGKRLLWIPTFRKHQIISSKERQKGSEWPPHPEDCGAPDAASADPVLSRGEPGANPGRTPEAILRTPPGMDNGQRTTDDGQRETDDARPASGGALAPPSPGPSMGELQALWNERLPHPPFPHWREIGSDQRKAAKRVRERPTDGPDGWIEILRRIGTSSFCRGSNDRGWVADPDFLLRVATPRKVLEGKYDDRAAPLIPMRRPFGGLPPEPPPPALAPGTQLPVLCDRCGERIPSTWDGERWLIPDHEWDGAPCVAPEIERRAAAGAEECV